jgi:chaperone required for assembly of F1-ATPase
MSGMENGRSGNGSSGSGGGDRNGAAVVRAEMRQPLPRRFYKVVAVGEVGTGHGILLDGRPARTPRKSLLALPTAVLAEAVAAEWAAQIESIDPAAMPLTRFANTALAGVTGREADVCADIVRYAGSDLLCYRAEHPGGLVRRQALHWDPVLDWAGERLGVAFVVASGLMPVSQPPSATHALHAALAPLDAFALSALHSMTTLTGSALLAFAVHQRRLDLDAAWTAAHVDEDWQIEEWGEDAEASARRARRRAEMDAAGTPLQLLGSQRL